MHTYTYSVWPAHTGTPSRVYTNIPTYIHTWIHTRTVNDLHTLDTESLVWSQSRTSGPPPSPRAGKSACMVHACMYICMYACMYGHNVQHQARPRRLELVRVRAWFMHACMYACMYGCKAEHQARPRRLELVRVRAWFMHVCIHTHIHMHTNAYMHECELAGHWTTILPDGSLLVWAEEA